MGHKAGNRNKGGESCKNRSGEHKTQGKGEVRARMIEDKVSQHAKTVDNKR